MKVLISAYACEPNRGSEPGAGWNWSLAAARANQVWVLTRANNRGAIEAELARRPQPNVRFVYVDLPAWARRWKRGGRGVRLYYSVWQIAAYRTAKRLHAEVAFDVVHHVTFANAWLPAGVAFVDAPFVLGPVDAGLSVPVHFYRELGMRGVLTEWKTQTVRALARLNPVTRAGIRRARLILAQNDESAERLGRFGRPMIVRPNATVDSEQLRASAETAGTTRGRTALVAGRLVALKGVVLAVRAISLLPDWSLEIVGSGPDERRLRRLVCTLGVEDRVTFIRWLPQADLWRRMAESSVVMVPSLRDAANLVVAEAATLSVPVVALDQGGPRVLARMSPRLVRTVGCRRPTEAVYGLMVELSGVRGKGDSPDSFSIERVADDLQHAYQTAIAVSVELPASAPVAGSSSADGQQDAHVSSGARA